MQTPRTLTLTLTLTLLTSGCGGLPKFARELAKDPATVSVDVRSLYGSITFRRSNVSSNHSATVTSDGSITVENIARPDNATDTILKRMVPPTPPDERGTRSRIRMPADVAPPIVQPVFPAPNSAP